MDTHDACSPYYFYQKKLGSPKYVIGPMVDHSSLPFRILTRRYGAELCYAPMINSKFFTEKNKAYREANWFTDPNLDRPIIAQFCGNNPETLLGAAKIIEGECDAIDINLGCPQHIAKRGHYGAYLQDEWDLISSMVRTLKNNISIPVTCKIRIFPDVQKTVRYAQMLEDPGCSILSVHGRCREQKGTIQGLADWYQIREVKRNLSIPIISNGNIIYHSDIHKCLNETQADAVMVAETSLYNPAIFSDKVYSTGKLALEFVQIFKKYEYALDCRIIQSHLYKIFKNTFKENPELRPLISNCKCVDDYICAINSINNALCEKYTEYNLSEYPAKQFATFEHSNGLTYKKYPFWVCQPYIRT